MNAALRGTAHFGGRMAALGVAMALFASPGLAQVGSISGAVVNKETREPINGASVSIVGTKISTISMSSGSFTLIGVAPGVYTIAARRVGFVAFELSRVEVRIGQTRALELALRTGNEQVPDRAEAEPVFVDPTIGSSAISLDREEIVSFPSLNLAGAFPIGGGYIDLPRSGATVSISDLRRGITTLPSVRGGRTNATEYLVDGISVNNPVFGASPILLDPLTASSVSFSPGFATPEYGGAMSGLVTQAIREGGDHLEGSAEYYNTGFAGLLGSRASAVSGMSAARAYLSGPLGPADGLRFAIGGHMLNEAAAVMQSTDGAWRGTGGNSHAQLVGKLTYAPAPSLRVSLSGVSQHRGGQTYDGGMTTNLSAPPAVSDYSRLLSARIEKRFSHANFSVAFADISANRESCSVWQGVCIQDRLQRIPLADEIPVGYAGPNTPYEASGQFFGGESYGSRVIRADAMIQASEHHHVRAGIYGTLHDIEYAGSIGYKWQQGVTLAARDVYRARPREFSAYVQDAIEHDLVTIRLGARFDYAHSGGVAFANPLSPTNGTTAIEVCQGRLPGVSETPFTYGTLVGTDACFDSPNNSNGIPILLDSAVRLAQRDDMRTVSSRVAFSPRIAISLPVSEGSAMYVNYGRFVRNPRYHDAFRYSGTGSRAGTGDGTDQLCRATRNRPGTTECAPLAVLDNRVADFVGNPALPFERSDAWEAGFIARVGTRHSMNLSYFSSTQSNLASLYSAKLAPDGGLTYGLIANNLYRTVLSRGNLATMGMTVTLRRQMQNHLSYIINYSWLSSSEVGAHPDLLAEALVDSTTYDNSREHSTARARPHTLNAQMTMLWRADTPSGLGKVGAILLRESRTVVTLAMATGSRSRTEGQEECGIVDRCSEVGRRVGGTGTLVNVMYAKALTTRGPQWSLVARVQNLLDKDDGSMQFVRTTSSRANSAVISGQLPGTRDPSTERVSLRRILAGMSVTF